MHVLPVRFTSSNKKFYPKLQKLETDSTTNDFTAQVAHYTRPSHSKFARKHNSGELHHLTLRKCLASLFRTRHSFFPAFSAVLRSEKGAYITSRVLRCQGEIIAVAEHILISITIFIRAVVRVELEIPFSATYLMMSRGLSLPLVVDSFLLTTSAGTRVRFPSRKFRYIRQPEFLL